MHVNQRLLFYQEAQEHRQNHACAGVPYEHGDILTALVAATHAQRILEVGTGIGYSAMCLAYGNEKAIIHTVDKDEFHIALAREAWKRFGIEDRIIVYEGKAEAILPTLEEPYDLIFYDGYVPQNKLLINFGYLLRKGGLLVTANLFLHDPLGGGYVRKLHDEKKWHTGIFADTALSVKLF